MSKTQKHNISSMRENEDGRIENNRSLQSHKENWKSNYNHILSSGILDSIHIT